TIDSDRKHLQAVLREATAHRGASLVEIYQNCPIFNDNAFEPLKEATTRDDITLRLEHGRPIASASKAVVRAADGSLQVVARDSVDPSAILVHDAHRPDPSAAFALSRLDEPAFQHVPIGIFRQVDRPSYDSLMAAQLEEAVAQQGPGDLAGLLTGGDTWRIG
ncbi:2-oxoacid:ferredoxin oxidoreductase subunit beta, partial [Nonomuraea sp. NPDC048826]